MTHRSDDDPRAPGPDADIDLRRLLPRWAVYVLSLVVIAAVALAAWLARKDRPTPAWGRGIAPFLGWAVIVLLAIAALDRLRRRR